MRKFLIFGMAIFMFGCAPKNNFVGKYISKDGPNYIELKEDSTFTYESRLFHLYQRSFGKWNINGGKRIGLNSKVQSIHLPLLAIRKKNNEIGSNNVMSLSLSLNGDSSLSDYKCRIYINEKLYSTKRGDSLFNIPIKEPIKEIFF